MRTYSRLEALKQWTFEEVCRGRKMKAQPPERDITRFEEPVEPRVFVAYAPKRFDESLKEFVIQAASTAPSITIMPDYSNVKYVEPQRFDQYKGVHRSQDYGQQLNVQVLFSVYQDDLRLPGFVDRYEQENEFELSLLREGTQEGLKALMDWMDDFKGKLLAQQTIPDTDMTLNEANFVYGMRADQKYIMDNRPIYYGLCAVNFYCVAEQGQNPEISAILD